ncbi:sensor histidine kinase [Virgisporangium aliadipatigenens]|uniref:sensor histidine kinase n=1 Tax=Virgisporangium aliadipatigenens TaxID=741659 RepID=UPI0019416863|nr:histidine kinase [Virgisporangium aliadipatigenens]
MELTVVRQARTAARRYPQLLDALLGCALVSPIVLAATAAAPHHPRPSVATTGVFAVVLAFLAVAGRRLWPLPILVVTGVAALGYIVVTRVQQPVLVMALVVLTYTVAARTDRRTTWLAAGTLAVSLCTAGLLLTASSWWGPNIIGVLASLGMAASIGDATRSRRAYVVEVEERARRAERSREEEVHRRVVEERMRIARELHDVVSHHIAVINVQAGAAGHVLDRQPQAARSALEHIRRASDTVLRELSSVVAVLRQADDLDLSTEPVRGLARLPELLDALHAAGLTIEHRQHGDARNLPAVVDLAAYRIVQEALTNAHKHGTGTARLRIAYLAENIHIEISNPVASTGPGAGIGYGIVGMRERAATAGGTLTTEAAQGRFVLRAALPAPAEVRSP